MTSLEHLCGYKSGQAATAPSPALADQHVDHHALTPAHAATSQQRSWYSRFFPSEKRVDELFAKENLGNWVVNRSTGEQIFESMPIYGEQVLNHCGWIISIARADNSVRLIQFDWECTSSSSTLSRVVYLGTAPSTTSSKS